MPKQRDILAPQFEDRIVHHAINNVLQELFTNKFIYHSYACIPGKGSQRAVNAVQRMMRSANSKYNNPYIVQADISKYFDSIDHGILLNRVNRTIKCKLTRNLYSQVISGHTRYTDLDLDTGIPVGSLTSQLSANIHLDCVDQRMVNYHGIGTYVRYMDDIVIVCRNKAHATEVMNTLNTEVNSISLRLNPKTTCFPVNRGVDFVGYRIFLSHILPRKRIIKNFRNSLKQLKHLYNTGKVDFQYIRPRLASAMGYSKYCRSYNTISNMISEFINSLDFNINNSNVLVRTQ